MSCGTAKLLDDGFILEMLQNVTVANDFSNFNSVFNKTILNERILVEDSLLESDDSIIIQIIDIPPEETLKDIKLKNANKIVFGHLLVSETKLNESFPDSKFLWKVSAHLIGKIGLTLEGV